MIVNLHYEIPTRLTHCICLVSFGTDIGRAEIVKHHACRTSNGLKSKSIMV